MKKNRSIGWLMLTCLAVVVYETCIDRPKHHTNHDLAAETIEGCI